MAVPSNFSSHEKLYGALKEAGGFSVRLCKKP